MKATVAILWILLLSSAACGAEKRYRVSSRADVEFSFIVDIRHEQYQGILESLPKTTISMDEAGSKKKLANLLKLHGVTPEGGDTFERIATRIYKDEIRPVLAPRVKAFNDLMNNESTKDSVSAGLIAFTGISKSMSRKPMVTALRIYGDYHYMHGDFDKGGRWKWHDKGVIAGQTKQSRTVNGEIDERITIDLKPYGAKQPLRLRYCCTGSVELKQTHGRKMLGKEAPEGKPVTTVRVRPYARIVVTKKVSPEIGFLLEGEEKTTIEKVFNHAAIHEVELRAEPWVDDRGK
jgi:hypothetical protein